MRNTILTLLGAVGVLVLCFTATAFAAGAASPPDGNLLDSLKEIWLAATGHHWWLAASAALVAGVAAFKKYAPGKARDWSHTDMGATLLLLLGSFGGALFTGLAATGTDAISADLVWAALKVAVGAAGGYAMIKNLLVDPLLKSKWYQEHAPAWLRAILDIGTWAFTKPAADTIKEAEKAGDQAVADKPAEGASADSAAGKPTEL
jgi:hypothetical protein